MKSLRLFLPILLIIIFIFPARSQWVPCQGIEGAMTTDIIIQDSTLFINTGGNGIFKRIVSENAWDSASIAGSFSKVRSTGNVLFCCGPMEHLYRSVDEGDSWETIEGFPWVYDMETLDSVVFIIYEGLLYRSVDNGDSWISVHPTSISLEMDKLFAQDGILCCSDNGADTIFWTVDYGINWSYMLSTGIEGYINDIFPFGENIWLATDSSIYIYNENATAWCPMNDSIPYRAFPESFFKFEDTLFCCTHMGLFYFDNLDSAWNENNVGLEYLNIYAGCQYGDTLFVATGSGPFYKYEGSDWIADYNDLFQFNVDQIFNLETRIYAIVQGEIFFSDDVTERFTPLQVQTDCSFNKIVISDTAWFAGSDCGFLVSVDSGLSWQIYAQGLDGKRVEDIALTDNYYFSGVYGGLYRSGRNPIIWERVPNEIGSVNVWGVNAVSNVVFARVYGNPGLYRSTDYGLTFSVVPEGGEYAPHLYIKDDLVFILNSYDYYTVLVSYDLGVSWQTWVTIPEGCGIACMALTDSYNTTIVCGMEYWNGAFYLSLFSPEEPGGVNIRDNLPSKFNPWILNILLDEGRILVSPLNYGLWYRDDLAVGVNENDNSIPASGSQLSIYPNPVNDVLHIHLENNFKKCEYQVIDYSGKMILKGMIENGSSDYSVDVSQFPQGIYFVMVWHDNSSSLSGKFIKIR
jgi:photosystem II stability/assembly factor-like uncharacterized protein